MEIPERKYLTHYHMHEYKKRGYLLENFRLFHQRGFGSNVDVDYHYHAFCKFLLFKSGAGCYMIDGLRYELQPGDVVLVDCNKVHKPEIQPDCDYERTILYLDPNFLVRESTGGCDLKALFAKEQGHILRLSAGQYQAVSAICEALEAELAQNGHGREILSKALVLQLMATLCRYQQKGELEFAQPAQPKNDRILDVLRYLDEHLCEELEVEQVAEHFFISKYQLMRLFNKETGTTIHAYLIQRRLLVARELIKEGLSATDACFKAGFRSYSSFTRAYSKYFGSTPTGRKDPSIAMSSTYE